ncbi:DUF5995 family protein [Echinicola rosea]|uniref:Uncharacterized protein n=1 Tax=Echinicola rosea TaxID=1807691 RepID=A0ABQ1UG33_9BACT|nr:DUF5995 family protein [Echinicola rosea]GGF17265.1 hypothetical protein GCM10011339_01490 [Echinicola rosea]
MLSIEEVITRMDQIVADCRTQKSRIGYFAILYRQVTKRIKEGIDLGEFEDNARMERLDIIFAKRFFDAYENYLSGVPTSQSWLCAFDTTKKTGKVILQHLLLGINAHINLDLGIATVQTMQGNGLETIKDDFDKINIILASMVDGVKTNLSIISPLFGFLIQLADGKDELLLNFSIQIARDGAWKFAQEYSTTQDIDRCFMIRDQAIHRIGNKIANPGKFFGWIVFVINLTEWKSIPQVMDRLEGIAQTATPNNLRTASL